MKPLVSIALDPNVIVLAPCDWDSAELLRKLKSVKNRLCEYDVEIVCDKHDLLKKEYKKHYDKGIEQGRRTLDMQFLDELLKQWDNWISEKPTLLAERSVIFLRGNRFQDEVEPELIALAAQPNVFLGIAPPNTNHPDLAPRTLINDPQKVELLRMELPEVDIEDTSHALARIDYVFLSRIFEKAAAHWIKKKYGYGRTKVNYKPPYLQQVEGGGEVDVYAFDDASEPCRVLVCECKLRMPGHEGTLLDEGEKKDDKEISKLIGKFRMVRDHESDKASSEGYSVRAYPIIISNAAGITQRASDLASKYGVKVYRASLPKDWFRYSAWAIERCEPMPNPAH